MTYPSPVALGDFQKYLRDGTTDSSLLAFYQSLLTTATEKIYTYLDRDFTPGAQKTDVFFGNGLPIHRMLYPCETIIYWKTLDKNGTLSTQDMTELVLMANGEIVVNVKQWFDPRLEHRIKYSQPAALACPESVMQVITEVAATIYEESKQGSGRLGVEIESDKSDTAGVRVHYLDLTDRQKQMLAPYKRMAV